MGFVCLCGQTVTALLTLCAFIAFMPGLPPDINFSVVKLDPFHPMEGPLKKNNYLDYAEKMYNGHLLSPESLASRRDGEIFTSSRDGSIHRIWGKNWENIEVVAKIGSKCEGGRQNCGHGLGVRFDNSGKLLVADVKLGMHSVDVDTGKIQRLFDPSEPIEGHKPMFVDDLDVDSKGNIYWSDLSYIAGFDDAYMAFYADPTGRLIKFDPKTKKNVVLVHNLAIANGVQLSPDESFVLVCESFKYRVQRYWLKGPKKGTTDIFVTGLPGLPDNIRPRKNGGYYVSLFATKNNEGFDIHYMASQYPSFRRFVIRVQWGLKSLADAINLVYPNEICSKISYVMLNFAGNAAWAPNARGAVVEVDENGKIIGSLQGDYTHVSQTDQIGDDLFISSPFNEYLGRIKLSDIQTAKPKKSSPPSGKDEL